jgi:predicted lipid-binding transport protein (Tim44 family)
MIRIRPLAVIAALATVLTLVAADANARAGGGSGSGSRGFNTFNSAPTTRTAPNAAQPIQRSVTQPGQTSPGLGQTGARPGFFGGGLMGGLAAGFIGAGLFGLLMGNGFLGGMGGFASILGLLLQVALIVIVAKLVFSWWQRRNSPAMAAATPSGGTASGDNHAFPRLGAMFGGNAPAGEPLTIEKSDYDDFEQLLEDIQTAYGAENIAGLRGKATPEMVSYFSDDLSDNSSRGLVNKISGVKLLQGDLSESWREGSHEYATVAMRFSLVDQMVERASGRVVEGSAEPQEATELWTFVRSHGGHWLLSAIQQT